MNIDDIRTHKNKARKIACLTAYTTPMAQSLAPHVDLLLVGDSLGTVLYGMNNTTGVTLDMMINHGKAVMRANPDCTVIVDMPFGTYEDNPEQALETAQRIMAETGAHGVKLEGGVDMKAQIAAITSADIPLMAHIGLLPQSVVKEGGYKIKGKDEAQITALLDDAKAVSEAGAFAVVIEGTIADAAEQVTNTIDIPTIGIGASPACDGQILVIDDLLGILHDRPPKFVTEYAVLRDDIEAAVARWTTDVRDGAFPAAENLYTGKKKQEIAA